MIETILFDFDDVLAYDAGENVVNYEFLNISKSEWDKASSDTIELLRGEFEYLPNIEAERAYMTRFFTKVLSLLNITNGNKFIDQLLSHHFSDRKKLFPGVKEMLENLSKKFSLGIVTNAFPSRRLYSFEPLGINKIIPAENITISAEVGYWKPNSKIFTIALEKMKADGKTTLFIDDKAKFLRGAAETGITHLIQRSADDEDNEFQQIKVVTELLDILK